MFLLAIFEEYFEIFLGTDDQISFSSFSMPNPQVIIRSKFGFTPLRIIEDVPFGNVMVRVVEKL